jgi:hypothetical protein
MKEFGYYLLFLLAVGLICLVFDGIEKDREIQIKQLDRQWKLDSTDKAERRKFDKELELLKLKSQK